ncbi:Sporulation protein YjcZ [Bacillus paramycoides]
MCFVLLSKGGTIMGFGGSCGGGFAGGFALLVVLFILLIIVGAACFC